MFEYHLNSNLTLHFHNFVFFVVVLSLLLNKTEIIILLVNTPTQILMTVSIFFLLYRSLLFLQTWNCSRNPSFVSLQIYIQKKEQNNTKKTAPSSIKQKRRRGKTPTPNPDTSFSKKTYQTRFVVDSDELVLGTFFSSIDVPLKIVSCTSFWYSCNCEITPLLSSCLTRSNKTHFDSLNNGSKI